MPFVPTLLHQSRVKRSKEHARRRRRAALRHQSNGVCDRSAGGTITRARLAR